MQSNNVNLITPFAQIKILQNQLYNTSINFRMYDMTQTKIV